MSKSGSKKIPLFDPLWLPLLKKPPPPTTAEAREAAAKQGAPLKHDWIKIAIEVAFREATATKKQRDKSDLAEARSVRRWCATRLKQRPALSDIREIVKAVRERFRQPD
jgi:hypothetical protein